MPLLGSFTPPGDKSISHRIALLGLLAEGQCAVSNISPCDDVRTSLAVCRALGCTVNHVNGVLRIQGIAGKVAEGPLTLDCGNSGTTMRLLCGILSGLKGSFILDGDPMLCRRPMNRVVQPLQAMGADISCADDKPPIRINGNRPLKGIAYTAPMASAQVKSALLLAGINAAGHTLFNEPQASRNHTEIMLQQFGARLECRQNSTRLLPGGLSMPARLTVPGDASGAAFFLTAAAFISGSDVRALNMSLNPTRIEFLRILRAMGAGVETSAVSAEHEPYGQVRVYYQGPLKGVSVPASAIAALIDEIPVLALAAANARGVTTFHGVGELAVKEVNRLLAIQRQLGLLGAEIKIAGDNLIIKGKGGLKVLPEGGLDSQHDHRMAMTLSLALKAMNAHLEIKGLCSVSISYPDFFADLEKLWQDKHE